MSLTNQNGDPVVEETLFEYWSIQATPKEQDRAIGLILNHLGMQIVRTNATKHGTVELELRRESENF
jgi:hypothetical protein